MTLINQNSTVTHNGNGVTTLWPYTFIIPDDDSVRVGLFDIATSALTELPETDYSITGVGDDLGGEVTYPLVGAPISAAKRLVIWRQVEYTQDTELTNQTPYYPVVLMQQLDRIVMQVQQLAAEADRSLKVTLGSTLDPDTFIAQLQQGAADAEASAVESAASAAAAAASAASIDPAGLIHVNTVDVFTEAQKGQGRGNIGGDLLAGFRNKLINGTFDIWQRGVSQVGGGYGSADRWSVSVTGSTTTMSRQTFALGQTDVPGNPTYYCRNVVVSVAGAGNLAIVRQSIEGVKTFAGRKATITFWAKADAPKNIALELNQNFGLGGAPSTTVVGIAAQLIALTTTWQKKSIVVDIPSIAGKTLGTNLDDWLGILFWFDAGSSFNARTANLGQQSGTFDISRVSIVEGDATAEADPTSPRHHQQELALCQRYYWQGSQTLNGGTAQNPNGAGYLHWQGSTGGAGFDHTVHLLFPVEMRASPIITRTDLGSTGFPSTAQSSAATAQGCSESRRASAAVNGAFCTAIKASAELS